MLTCPYCRQSFDELLVVHNTYAHREVETCHACQPQALGPICADCGRSYEELQIVWDLRRQAKVTKCGLCLRTTTAPDPMFILPLPGTALPA